MDSICVCVRGGEYFQSDLVTHMVFLSPPDECKRSEEKELEFKRINAKYELLLKEKERMDNELKGELCFIHE